MPLYLPEVLPFLKPHPPQNPTLRSLGFSSPGFGELIFFSSELHLSFICPSVFTFLFSCPGSSYLGCMMKEAVAPISIL